ncbi:hypothetical protein KGP36_04050 [Patescibacteria group bacterium]|nr:hypothetical protein [Patescibacteria group bacterium]
MPNAALITPHAPFVDLTTGKVNREWFRFLNAMSQLLGGGASVSSLSTLQTDINTIDSNIATANSNIATANSNIATINSEITTINSEITTINSKLAATKGTVYKFNGKSSPFSISLSNYPTSIDCLSLVAGTYTKVGIGWTMDSSFNVTFDTGGDSFTGAIVIATVAN